MIEFIIDIIQCGTDNAILKDNKALQAYHPFSFIFHCMLSETLYSLWNRSSTNTLLAPPVFPNLLALITRCSCVYAQQQVGYQKFSISGITHMKSTLFLCFYLFCLLLSSGYTTLAL